MPAYGSWRCRKRFRRKITNKFRRKKMENEGFTMPEGIGAKLSYLQKHLNAPKNQYNAFGKYNYRSLEDITQALKPLLKMVNARLTFSDDIIEVSGRVYVKATATLTCNTDGNSETVTAYAREPLNKKGADESQITGTASSYARKYSANGLFCIDDSIDADSADNTEYVANEQVSYTKVVNDAITNIQSAWNEQRYNDVVSIWTGLNHLDQTQTWNAFLPEWQNVLSPALEMPKKG